ncbi:hypothetical protein ACN4EG_24945 [Alkalinema pantanalense CENA528]|uniref:hypothetical protein n=1 Tax=Alkalinema pantanalense TaxID=1620705 RepID=UPI003D6EBBB3
MVEYKTSLVSEPMMVRSLRPNQQLYSRDFTFDRTRTRRKKLGNSASIYFLMNCNDND